MAPAFIPIWKELRADGWSDQSKIMVPLTKTRLVLLDDANGQSPVSGPGIDVEILGKEGVLKAIDQDVAGVSLTDSDRKNVLGALHSRVTTSVANGGRLLSVKGRLAGNSWLKAGNARLDLVVADATTLAITFKFFSHLDDDGSMVKATTKSPGDAADWVPQLNWILGKQANVWFDPYHTDSFELKEKLGSVSHEMLRNKPEFKKAIDSKADVTVFLVGKWKDSGARTIDDWLPDQVVVINDNPGVPVVKGDDSFLVTLAHELVHVALTKFHPEWNHEQRSSHFRGEIAEEGFLYSKNTESSVISAPLLNKLYPPKK